MNHDQKINEKENKGTINATSPYIEYCFANH